MSFIFGQVLREIGTIISVVAFHLDFFRDAHIYQRLPFIRIFLYPSMLA